MANEILKGMSFHHIALKVRDFDKSVEFYSKLGCKTAALWDAADGKGCLLDIGNGGNFEIFGGNKEDYCCDGKWAHFALLVENADQAYNLAIAAGAESNREPVDIVVPTQSPIPPAHSFCQGS